MRRKPRGQSSTLIAPVSVGIPYTGAGSQVAREQDEDPVNFALGVWVTLFWDNQQSILHVIHEEAFGQIESEAAAFDQPTQTAAYQYSVPKRNIQSIEDCKAP